MGEKGTYRTIYTSFWTDTKIEEEFTPEDKYFYLYILTNSRTNLCGCFEVGLKQMSDDTGYNQDAIKRLIQRFEINYNVIRYNFKNKEMLVLNWHKYNWTKSNDLIKAVRRKTEEIKTQEFKKYVLDLIEGVGRVPTPSSDGGGTSVTDTVTDTNNINNIIDKSNNKRFIKPTLEQVQSYCEERHNNVDPEQFVNHYESNGWQVGKGPMKDWKAAVRYWEGNEYSSKPTQKKKEVGFDLDDFFEAATKKG